MRIFCFLCFLLTGFFLTGIPVEASKAKILYLYSDKGQNSQKTEKAKRKQFKKIGKYMDPILIKKLKKADFKVKLLDSPQDFKPKDRRFYLYVTLLDYERNGSVPFYLKVYFELSEDGLKPFMKQSFEIESKRSWKKCAIKAAKLISDALVQNKNDILTSDEAKVVKRTERFDDKDISDQEEAEEASPEIPQEKAAEEQSAPPADQEDFKPSSESETSNERMKKLTELYDAGMISEEEYFRKKEEILSDL